jgi:hypothetical protein
MSGLAEKTILESLEAALRGTTIAEQRADWRMAKPISGKAHALPAIRVLPAAVRYTPFDDGRWAAAFEFDVEFYVAESGQKAEQQLADLRQQVDDVVLRWMFTSEGLLGLAGLLLSSVSPEDLGPVSYSMGAGMAGETPIAVGTSKFRLTYLLELGDPSAGTSAAFLRAGVEWDFAPPDGTIDATDDISLPGP